MRTCILLRSPEPTHILATTFSPFVCSKQYAFFPIAFTRKAAVPFVYPVFQPAHMYITYVNSKSNRNTWTNQCVSMGTSPALSQLKTQRLVKAWRSFVGVLSPETFRYPEIHYARQLSFESPQLHPQSGEAYRGPHQTGQTCRNENMTRKERHDIHNTLDEKYRKPLIEF